MIRLNITLLLVMMLLYIVILISTSWGDHTNNLEIDVV